MLIPYILVPCYINPEECTKPEIILYPLNFQKRLYFPATPS